MSGHRFRSSRRIRQVPCPEPDHREWVRILIPPAGPRTLCWAVHQAYEGYLVHYLDDRTSPCLESPTWCEGCKRGQSPRWEGYIGAVIAPTRAVRLVKLTRAAVQNCASLQKANGSLRGVQLSLQRRGKANNSALQIELYKTEEIPPLPGEWPMLDSLTRLWGFSLIGDGATAGNHQIYFTDNGLPVAKGGGQ